VSPHFRAGYRLVHASIIARCPRASADGIVRAPPPVVPPSCHNGRRMVVSGGTSRSTLVSFNLHCRVVPLVKRSHRERFNVEVVGSSPITSTDPRAQLRLFFRTVSSRCERLRRPNSARAHVPQRRGRVFGGSPGDIGTVRGLVTYSLTRWEGSCELVSPQASMVDPGDMLLDFCWSIRIRVRWAERRVVAAVTDQTDLIRSRAQTNGRFAQ
jgi:hypothetical protein